MNGEIVSFNMSRPIRSWKDFRGISKESAREYMQLGGWSDYQTMRTIYTHLSKSDTQKSVKKLTEFFGET